MIRCQKFVKIPLSTRVLYFKNKLSKNIDFASLSLLFTFSSLAREYILVSFLPMNIKKLSGREYGAWDMRFDMLRMDRWVYEK